MVCLSCCIGIPLRQKVKKCKKSWLLAVSASCVHASALCGSTIACHCCSTYYAIQLYHLYHPTLPAPPSKCTLAPPTSQFAQPTCYWKSGVDLVNGNDFCIVIYTLKPRSERNIMQQCKSVKSVLCCQKAL